ncbi:hypothetical protein ACTXGL_01465 [Psychrobacter sp. T6-6]|uniref:hypothetical protein n=1 Tax=Psychrobacter sp. T6-6 TaxID=3457452 RepID=UPI003FD55D85
MTELSEQQPRLVPANPVRCNRCDDTFTSGSIDHLCFDKNGNCQMCRAELSGKYADGQCNALTDLIIAAKGLRKASADYTDSGAMGEIHYADAIHESVDLLIDALNNYEGGGE